MNAAWHPGRANQPFEWAAVTTLDEWWARHRGNHSSVFLAKIDAEKHEWEVGQLPPEPPLLWQGGVRRNSLFTPLLQDMQEV